MLFGGIVLPNNQSHKCFNQITNVPPICNCTDIETIGTNIWPLITIILDKEGGRGSLLKPIC